MLQVLSDPIARLKPCLRCRASLKGHLDDKYCPHCGLSVWLSLNAGDSLDASNPAWLRRVTLASFAMSATQLAGIALAGAVYAWPGGIGLFIAAHCLISAIPLVLLSANEHRHPDKLKTHRMWLNIAAAAQFIAGLILLFYPMAMAYYFVYIGVYAAGALATWFYLRRLIRRSAKAGLAKYASWILFIPALAIFLKIPIFGICIFYQVARFLLPVIPVVYFPASVVLLILYGLVFKQSAIAAEEHWKKESDPAKQTSLDA